MCSPTTKTDYQETNTSGNRRPRPGPRRRTPLRRPRRERGAPRPLRPGPGRAEFGLRRALSGQGSGDNQVGGAPKVAMERGRPRATDFTLRVGCGFPRTPPALSEPPSPRVSEPPPRSLPAIHSTVPFLQAGPGLPSGSPDAPTPGGRGPGSAGPGASGRRGEQAARRAPQAEVSAGGAEARGPPLLPPDAGATWFQTASVPGPYPAPHRVAEV